MTIDGFIIDEGKDLNENLRLLENHLRSKYTFWGRFSRGIEKIELSMGTKKPHTFLHSIYFLLLLPAYIKYTFQKKRTEAYIESSILQLEDYYRSPKMRVIRFKARCELKKNFYQQEISLLRKELEIQKENSNKSEIGEETQQEIKNVISSLKENIERKKIKFNFYRDCEEKLKAIESQILVKESLQASKKRILEMKDLEVEQSIKDQVEEEFRLFESYGNLLDGISNNLRELREEKEGLFDVLEVEQLEEEFIISKQQKND